MATLERPPSEEGDLRLASPRRGAVRPQHRLAREADRLRDVRHPVSSGRADTILYNDFKQPAGEVVLVQSASLTADSPKFRAVVLSVVAGSSGTRGGCEGRVAVRSRERWPGLRRQALGSDRSGVRRPEGGRDRQGRPRRRTASPRCRRRTRTSTSDPSVRAQGRQINGSVLRRPEEGRALLPPPDAGDPSDRVRRTRGGRDPASC